VVVPGASFAEEGATGGYGPSVLQHEDLEPPLRNALEPDEVLHLIARANDSTLAISDRRLLVASSDDVRLSVPFEGLRRVEFDIERNRPATLVIVPTEPSDPPEVLSIAAEQYQAAADVLVALGHHLRMELVET
jgi:hypothetical protein